MRVARRQNPGIEMRLDMRVSFSFSLKIKAGK
jgi:hypothetical protein